MPLHSIKIHIDEAGRGPLAGPVTVGCAVLLKPRSHKSIRQFQDSKALTERRREELYTLAQTLEEKGTILTSSGFASNTEIDTLGIIPALHLACTRAIFTLIHKLSTTLDTPRHITDLIIDGNHTFGLDVSTGLPVTTIIKGDATVPLISLASIIAKVERDRYMIDIASTKTLLPYGLAQHKGYGTKQHREAIATYGISPIHRQTFCKNIIPK